MLKQGLICELNANDGTARVKFMDDDVISNWLPISVVRAGQFQFICPFSINEQVWCVMDESCTNGVIAGSTYNKKMPVPEGTTENNLILTFGNNSTITINGEDQTLKIDIEGDCEVKSGGNVKIEAVGNVDVKATSAKVDATSVEIKGAATAKIQSASITLEAATVTATGTLAVAGGITAASIAAGSFSGPSGGAMTSSSDIITTGDVKAGGKSLTNHVHNAPGGSGGATTPPL